ncbi:amidase signature domain-containing protein [Aspergillus novoparasiticus]|uniref:Amidase signature domain-containing protein n=1 Tax=Aspergillus novoparasiticus TaxID=986946 RepID=A0A5N6F894_9EURO|nr:amidase signature domain-containing protein [Aspergillus novoparasiticus]
MGSNETGAKSNRSWTEVVTAKRAIRDTQIRKHEATNRNGSFDILGADIAEVKTLTNLLGSGQVSAEDMIRAYIGRACEAQRKTNCLTEICFDDAIDQARHLDNFQRTHGRLIGPLHGVPMSVKDQFNIKGLDSTLGYVCNAFTPAKSDAPLVRTLKQLGAIIIAKTNLPQSIMWCETDNPLWGLTTHPTNPKLTPGGASGGEAALLALGGSLIGWGTDIGGSIRIPCHMNGLWGLKPSSGRMSYRGVEVSLDGQQHVPSAVGPMAKSLSSLTVVTKLVIAAEPWTIDPQLPPIPWRDNIFRDLSTRPLVIGTMLDDGAVRVHPPIERVFCELASRLKAAGHAVVEWGSSWNSKCIEVMDEYYTADGGEDIRRAVAAGGEPFVPQIQAFVDRGRPVSVFQYWQLNKRKVTIQQAYHDMWDSIRSLSGQPVDVLLVPTMPHTAVPHGSCRWTGYTKPFNFLDYTALTFPAGIASKDQDQKRCGDYAPRNAHDAWNWGLHDSSAMDGHSIGLQIVGRRFDEEKVLGAAQQIQQLL